VLLGLRLHRYRTPPPTLLYTLVPLFVGSIGFSFTLYTLLSVLRSLHIYQIKQSSLLLKLWFVWARTFLPLYHLWAPTSQIFKLRFCWLQRTTFSFNPFYLLFHHFFITFFFPSTLITQHERLGFYTTPLYDKPMVILSFHRLVHLCLTLANIYLSQHFTFFLLADSTGW
jgi:hypothetical protein